MSAEDLEDSATDDALDGADECPTGDGAGTPDLHASAAAASQRKPLAWRKVLVFGGPPAVAVFLAALAGFLGWQDFSHREAQDAAAESVAVARDTTQAILSYKADTVEQDLNAVRDRLGGSFLESYADLVSEVVIPGAREMMISAVAEVPAAASVSATPSHAVALVFIDQTVTMGTGVPTKSASGVRVTLDKVDGRWLVSGFDPV